MSNVFEIKPGIFYTGVVDKDLEIFDIIMETKYGTTYNSYLIKDEKIVLFDTVKDCFKDEFLSNLKEIVDIKDIDYVVVHHTEPDHAGCLKYILDINPNVEVICTSPAKLYLSDQVNRDFNCTTVKTGDKLNIGIKTLEFIQAPFLHWADTMFTYIPEDRTLLTCDAFGCHYSEFDAKGIDGEGYLESAKLYYDCIVKPYAKFVLDAVDKVVELKLDFDTILTSHGPILSQRPMEQVARYVEWSKTALEEANQGEMAIFYLSAYTNTFDMAKKIQQGALSQDVKVKLYDLEKLSLEEMHTAVLNAKVVLVGSPTINKTMVKPMWDLFSTIDPMANKGTIAGVFGSYGWSGEGITMAQNLFQSMGFKVPQEALKKKFFPSDDTFKECFDYGVEFAQFLK